MHPALFAFAFAAPDLPICDLHFVDLGCTWERHFIFAFCS